MKKDTEFYFKVGTDGRPTTGQIKFEPIGSLGEGTVRVTYTNDKTGNQAFADLPKDVVEVLATMLVERQSFTHTLFRSKFRRGKKNPQ